MVSGFLHFFHQCRSTSMAHLLEQKSPQSTSEASAESPSAKTNTGEWSNTLTRNSTHSTNSFHWLEGSPLQSCDCSSWVVGRHREEDQRDNKWDHQRVLGCLARLSAKNGKIRWTNPPQKMKHAIWSNKNYLDFTFAWKTIFRANLKTKLH